MDASDLIVEVRDRTLARVGQFSDSDLVGFTVVARANDVGQWEATLPHTIFDVESGDEIIYSLAATLRTKGAGIIVSGPNGVILSGPMTEAKYEATSDENHGTWTITGVSDTIMLEDALAYPQPSNADATTQTTDNDERTGAAETVMKQYVSANIGPSAPAGRKWSDLNIQTDAGLGATVYGAARFDNLLALLQSLASVGNVQFDVAQVGLARVFRVWQPQDRSALVRFDIDNGQLTTIDYGYGSPTSTRVIVGGPGDNVVDRTFVYRTSTASSTEETLWNRRIEGFISDTSTDDTVVLSQEGDDALSVNGVTVQSVSITPSEDLSSTYMVDWSLGDTVTVVIGDAPATTQVTEATVKASENGLLIGATLGDPTGFDPDGIAYAKQQETADKVASIERSGANGTQTSPTVDWSAIQNKPTTFPADLSQPSNTLGLANGGTGATSAASARTALGLGSLATLSTAPIANGGTGATTAAAARTNLGLGSFATLSSASLSSGMFYDNLPINIGGTGASTAAQALTNLGAVAAQDTGWINLTYKTGYTGNGTPGTLRYRVLNGILYVKGGATGSWTSGTYTPVASGIPAAYVPQGGGSSGVSARAAGVGTSGRTVLFQFDTDGTVEVAWNLNNGLTNTTGASGPSWVECSVALPIN